MTAVGVDVGGTRIKCGLVGEAGAILAQQSRPTPDTLAGFREALREMVAAVIGPGETPRGIGIGCKGIIDPATSRVEALPGTLRFLEGLLLSELAPPGFAVHADNDARAAMAGEMRWGAARGLGHALLITLGTGVGGAVVAEGRLLRGVGGVAGHLGHMTIDPEGPDCICGNRGCLETFFSARAIEAEAFRVVHAGCESALTARFHGQPERITCQAVFEAAACGDAVALRIRDRAIAALGAALAGLVHVFDPEVIILGGQISEAGHALLVPLAREIHLRTRRLLRREVPLAPQQVADPSGIAGAAALVFASL